MILSLLNSRRRAGIFQPVLKNSKLCPSDRRKVQAFCVYFSMEIVGRMTLFFCPETEQLAWKKLSSQVECL